MLFLRGATSPSAGGRWVQRDVAGGGQLSPRQLLRYTRTAPENIFARVQRYCAKMSLWHMPGDLRIVARHADIEAEKMQAFVDVVTHCHSEVGDLFVRNGIDASGVHVDVVITPDHRVFAIGPHAINLSGVQSTCRYLLRFHPDHLDPSIIRHELGHAFDTMSKPRESNALFCGDYLSEAFADFTAFAVTGNPALSLAGKVVRDIRKPPSAKNLQEHIRRPVKYQSRTLRIHDESLYFSHFFYQLAQTHGVDPVWKMFYELRLAQAEIYKSLYVPYFHEGNAEKEWALAAAWKAQESIFTFFQQRYPTVDVSMLRD